jgi:hypothetical protein
MKYQPAAGCAFEFVAIGCPLAWKTDSGAALENKCKVVVFAQADPPVRGHEKVPGYGQLMSPLVAMKSPRWWPPEVPTPH